MTAMEAIGQDQTKSDGRELGMDKHNQLELMLAIRRICGRAAAEGKTHLRAATLRRMDAQIKRVKKLHDGHPTLPLAF